MHFSRRGFARGTLGLAVGSQLAWPALALARPELAAALSAIRAYGEAHRRHFNLPGMTLGLVTPDGQRSVMNFGFANRDARTPITAETLFQIGSISKVLVAILLRQFAAEGRIRLQDRVSNLVPAFPLPRGNAVTVQHLLDHVAGLPADAPLFPEGGLWTAYLPEAHWYYSNTGYDMLGKLAEHIGGKPLAQLLRERILAPLNMNHSKGAIVGADRLHYAQGYEAADPISEYARGVPLAPAPWVDVTFGAGCVASTADDMLNFMDALAGTVQGKNAFGLTAEQGREFATHSVPTPTTGMRYGNGLMHMSDGGRSYLHHTGGMLSFSSSFHVDLASGVGAFASSTITAYADYRPRLLTRFAVDALTNALAARPLPSPPGLVRPVPNAASYAGRYSGPAGSFEIRKGVPLTILANGVSAPLELASDEIFRTAHPQFQQYSFLFERRAGSVVLAGWGPHYFEREGAGAEMPASSLALRKLAGRYVNDNPWFRSATIVERGAKLWVGTETPMTRIRDNVWRVGKEAWSPERASFRDFIDGRPQTLVFSGEKFVRHEI
jgi:CubicO group peptidase (beta-lactamase class C family)